MSTESIGINHEVRFQPSDFDIEGAVSSITIFCYFSLGSAPLLLPNAAALQ